MKVRKSGKVVSLKKQPVASRYSKILPPLGGGKPAWVDSGRIITASVCGHSFPTTAEILLLKLTLPGFCYFNFQCKGTRKEFWRWKCALFFFKNHGDKCGVQLWYWYTHAFLGKMQVFLSSFSYCNTLSLKQEKSNASDLLVTSPLQRYA